MSNIFRRKSLDQLDSPGQIPGFVRVTHPPLYLVLLAMMLCCLVVSLWVIFGTVTERIKAQAIVFSTAKTQRLSLPYAGVTDELLVERGQYVTAGQPVMVVRHGKTLDTLRTVQGGMVIEMKNPDGHFNAFESLVYVIPISRQTLNADLLAFVKYSDLRALEIGQEVQVTPADLHREDYGYVTGTITHISVYPISRAEARQTYWLHNFVNHLFPEDCAYQIDIKLNTEKQAGHQRLKWSRRKSESITLSPLSFCHVQIVTQRKPVYKVIFRY